MIFVKIYSHHVRCTTFMTRRRWHQKRWTPFSKIIWTHFLCPAGTFIFCGVRLHRPCKFTNLWIWETTLLIRYFRFNALARKSVALCVTLKARAFISTLHTDSYNKLISVTLFTHCRDFMCGIKSILSIKWKFLFSICFNSSCNLETSFCTRPFICRSYTFHSSIDLYTTLSFDHRLNFEMDSLRPTFMTVLDKTSCIIFLSFHFLHFTNFNSFMF